VFIRYQVTGDEEVAHDLLAFGARMADPRVPLLEIAELMRAKERDTFDEEGPGWAPLADSTIAAKSYAGLDPRVLHATLALRESLTGMGDGNITVATSSGLWFGSSIDYGKLHKTGTSKMPARDPLPFRQNDAMQFSKVLQRWMVGLDRARFGPGAR
jgi:phage gpG-like protein